ncbi:MAG: phosphotransferase [Pseudomonadota bacterium]|nr:phosphotransferase [Pseudomonadota bacterium]
MEKITDKRFIGLAKWAQQYFPCQLADITPISGDASFRRYFRATRNGETCILVDADPQHENNAAYIGVASAFGAQGVHVPAIQAVDLEAGYLVITDLGDQLFSQLLNSSSVDSLYLSAIDALITIQKTPKDTYAFPDYDEKLLQKELDLFADWYLAEYLQINLAPRDKELLASTSSRLIDLALEQPRVVVHRDYHSRNLMLLPEGKVGVLDFQDAVYGPVTYDLVSLLKDCYVMWPASNVNNWVQRYFEKAQQAGVIADVSMTQYLRWFDWMGVQRHLKCVGIFARLHIRDKKPQYLADIPRIFDYILGVCARHPKLNGLSKFLQTKVLKHESNGASGRPRQPLTSING